MRHQQLHGFCGTFRRNDCDHADAAVERAMHLRRAIEPARASQSKRGSCCQRLRWITASSVSGNTRGMLSVSPPPVMCAKPCTGIAGGKGEHALDVDAVGFQEPVEQGASVERGAGVRAGYLDELAYERISIRVHSR